MRYQLKYKSHAMPLKIIITVHREYREGKKKQETKKKKKKTSVDFELFHFFIFKLNKKGIE